VDRVADAVFVFSLVKKGVYPMNWGIGQVDDLSVGEMFGT